MLIPPTIDTGRLVLAPLRVEDAEVMVGVLADRRMYEFTGGEPPSLERLRARYEQLVVGRSPDGTEQWLNLIVSTRDPDEVVGVVQATVSADGSAAEVAWEVGVPWQGRGYAGEAAAALVAWLVEEGVGVVDAHVHPDHVASARVAQRAGLAATDVDVDGERRWRWAAD